MPRVKKIEYIVDDKGRKKMVLMSYRAFRELMEDIADLQTFGDPRDEQWEDAESVIAEIENARKA